MKIHHLNCGTMALGAVDHCLLVETDDNGLLLVDTGFGLACIRDPKLLGWTRHLIGPVLREEETAVRQIEALGYRPIDVRNIIVTHLDYDHTGGLSDFPWATVHVHGPERRASLSPTLLDRIRYRTEQLCAHDVKWSVNESGGGQQWYGFEAVRDLPGIPPEILVVPLYGHSRGHIGVAIDTGDGWLLHAGDAFTFPSAIAAGITGRLSRAAHVVPTHPSYPVTQLRNARRLAELVAAHSDSVTVFCSHDGAAFTRFAGSTV